MTLDIRYPIGWLFSVIGVLLVAQGAFGGPAPTADVVDLNIDLWWGLAMLVFGGGMLALAQRHGRRGRSARGGDAG